MPVEGISSTASASPRSSRRERPLGFIPMPPQQQFNPYESNAHPSGASSNHSHAASRPHSPSYYRQSILEVQSVLYGGRGRDREEISQLVDDLYDTNATFENPLTLAKGKKSIKEMFNLLALVPGAMHSEIGQVAEAQGYDGIHLALMQHTLHIAFMPFLDPQNPIISMHSTPHTPINRSYSFFSLPTTPHTQYSPPLPDGHGIFSKTHPATSETSTSKWPLQHLMARLNPRNIAKTLTTVHIKLHTSLVFNEHGKIIVHEDTWGLKELVEGVFPIIGTLYALQRQGFAFLGGVASRMLLGRSSGSDEESKGSGHSGGNGTGSMFHGSSLKYGIGPDGKYVDFSLLEHQGPRGGSLASASDDCPQAGMATPDPPSLDFDYDNEHDDLNERNPRSMSGAGPTSDCPIGSPMSTRHSSVSGPGGIWLARDQSRVSRPAMKEAQVQTQPAHAHAHFERPATLSLGAGLELESGELAHDLPHRKSTGGGLDRDKVSMKKQLEELARERERESAVTTTIVD